MAVGRFTDKPNLANGQANQILDVLPTVGGWTGGYGGAWPATIWHAFMSSEFNNIKVLPLPTPSYTGTDPLFTKWIMALPPKKPKRCQDHQHAFFFFFGHDHHGNGNGQGSGAGAGWEWRKPLRCPIRHASSQARPHARHA